MEADLATSLGIWTFSGREWGIARCRSLALPLFSDGDMSSPELADGVAFFFGLQDSHRTADERAKHLPPLRRKDLALVCLVLRSYRAVLMKGLC